MNDKQHKVLSGASEAEQQTRSEFAASLATSPVPNDEILFNLGLYMPRQALSRVLFMSEIYQQIVDVHGVVMEFGVRWGQNLALFSNLRGIYEPFNYNRRVIGFDTFEGFPSVDDKDGAEIKVGDYSVAEGYEEYLRSVLSFHESQSPIAQKTKFELVKGDATKTVPQWFADHPETVVALSYFDFDLYQPTKVCLEQVLLRSTKGSIIVFDELNCPEFPGETIAVMEVMGLSAHRLKRSPLNPLISYIEIQ